MTSMVSIELKLNESEIRDVDEALDNLCRSQHGESFVYDTLSGACVHNVDYDKEAKVPPYSPQLVQQNYYLR